MNVQLGMHVTTSDGKDVGKVDKLIAEPKDGHIKAAVVRKGFILHDDVEIPIELFDKADVGGARLRCSSEQVDDLPRFAEELYTQVPVDYQSPYGYPPVGMIWPTAAYPAAYPAAAGYIYDADRPENRETEEMLRKQRLENAVIDEGSEVKSRDGEKIGEIHSVAFDTATGMPTRLVIRKGFLFTEDLELPVSAIESVDDDVVYLGLTKEQALDAARPIGRR